MYKVIIADDNALSIKGLEHNLDFDALGAELVGAFYTGTDVLEYVREHDDVDLIVSDIRMPHMNGLELAREVLKLHRHLKIVFISAYTDFEWAQEALRIGAADYVQKPIVYPDLQEAMKNALMALQQEREIQARLEQALPEMQKRFFQDLLQVHPDMAERQLGKQAAFLDIPAEGGAFLCVAVTWEESDTPQDTETRLLTMLTVQEQMENWFGSHMKCHMVWQRDTMIVVLHDSKANAEELPKRVAALCASYIEAQPTLTTNLVFGVGKAFPRLWNLPQSLDSAQRALISCYIHQGESVFIDPLDERDDLTFFTSLTQSQRQLSDCILSDDAAALNVLVSQISARLTRRCTQSSLVYAYVMMLCTGIIDSLRQEGVDFSAATEMLNRLDYQNRRLLDQSVILDFLNGFLKRVGEAINVSQQTQHQMLVRRIQKYVNDNLDNPDLGLEDISAEVHISKSHLSRIFKRFIGTNVSDWITRLRITRAQQLLRQTDTSISVISEQVGYASSYYFSACFKKITGQTPSEYRNEMMKK